MIVEEPPPREATGQGPYQARWISRDRLNELRRAGGVGDGMLIDHFRGVVIVEPVGSNLGDGEILTPEAADYELRQVWCLSTPRKLDDARQLLGLEADATSAHFRRPAP